MDDLFNQLMTDFLLDSRERTGRLETLLLDLVRAPAAQQGDLVVQVRRELHTLKGSCGMMAQEDLRALTHAMEDLTSGLSQAPPDIQPLLQGLDAFRHGLDHLVQTRAAPVPQAAAAEPAVPVTPDGDPGQGSVRVPAAALDELVDVLSEMVIFRNRLADAIATGKRAADPGRAWEDVQGAQESLGKTLGLVQERVMRLRMVPLQTLFSPLRRLVHDESLRLGKDVRLDVHGGDTAMDKALLELASNALGHLVRNAVVHGIEAPAARRAAGKPAQGVVRLTAFTHRNEVWMEVTDDGAGIDTEALLQAAQEQGRQLLPGQDPQDLLFQAGLSTRRGADLSSGRGMGLSAAREAVQRHGGRLDLRSQRGQGTTFRLHVPLSVSIIRALLIRADGEDYALPLTAIVETLRFQESDGHLLNHAGTYPWRGRVLPLLDLGHAFRTASGLRRQGYVVILEADGKQRGLLGDDLVGIREIVVKGLDPVVGTPPGVSGSTILGDGRVILILDPAGLVAMKPFLTPMQPQGGAP